MVKKVAKGTRVSPECLHDAKKQLNLFSEDELKEFTKEVFARMREYDNLGGEAALKQALKDVKKDHMEMLIGDAASKARNVQKFEQLKRGVEKGYDTRQFIIRTKSNKDYNVESAQRAAQDHLYNESFGKLSKEHFAVLQSGQLDEQILAAMDGVEVQNKTAKEIADILKRYPDEVRNPMLVQSGALQPEYINPDRFLRNFYEPSRVATAGDSSALRALMPVNVNVDKAVPIFREKMKAQLDFEKTFARTDAMDIEGKLDMKEVDRIIDKSFDNIVNNRHAIFTKSVVANDREALKKKRRMFYHFKDWRAWGRINKEFGKGSLFNAFAADIQGTASQVGMANIFGSSPEVIYNDLRKLQQSVRPITPYREREADMLFKQLRGVDRTAWSPTLANFGAASRTLTSMARLGSLVLNSLSDISQAAGVAQRFGYSYWKAYANGVIHAFNLIPSESRSEVAKIFKGNIDTHMGYMGRFVDATHMGDVMSKASNTFFWMNFTNAWDKGLKLSAMTPIAEGLGKDSGKTWRELKSQTRSQMQKFNINEHEWEGLRGKTDKLFTTDNVNELTNAELKSIWEKGDKAVPFVDYRSHLYRKVYGFFDMASENSVLDPRAYERMATSYNLPPGTWGGEAVRSIMQFKSYPIANFRRVWYGGMADMDSASAKFMYATNMAVGNMMLGYLGMILTSYIRGVTPQDPSMMSMSEKERFYAELLAPGLGTFLRVLDPKNQNPHMVTDLILTPSVRLFTDPLATGFALATGNVDQAKRTAKDFLSYANPIGTLPIAESYIDSLMGKEPYMAPGQRPL